MDLETKFKLIIPRATEWIANTPSAHPALWRYSSICLALYLLLAALPLHAEDDGQRSATPRPCYLLNWNKGPNWLTDIPLEFQLHYFQKNQPLIDDTLSAPTPKALKWKMVRQTPKVEEIAYSKGRRIIRLDYPDRDKERLSFGSIMIVIETSPNSNWFTPFFVAEPEQFEGRFISGKDFPFAYLATAKMTGTASFRTHYLFDLEDNYPKLVKTVSAGRVRRDDFDSDNDYRTALKALTEEQKILLGER